MASEEQWPPHQPTKWVTENTTLVAITIFSIFFFFSYLYKWFSSNKKLNLPPALWSPPLLGNLHQLGSIPHLGLSALSRKHGPLILLHLGKAPAIVISSAELAQEVLRTQDPIFASRTPSSLHSRIFYNAVEMAFSPYGQHWRQIRRIGVVHFLNTKRVESFRAAREEEVDLMLEKIRKSETPVNLSEMFVALTNGIVCRAAFGRKYSDGDDRFYALLGELSFLLGVAPLRDFVPWLGWVDRLKGLDARVKNLADQLDCFLEKVIEDRLNCSSDEKAADGNNFVQTLLSLDADETGGVPLPRDTIKALILDMFAAGTGTTFTAVDWTMAELMRNPKAKKKVREEIRAVMGAKQKVREEDIDRMPYLKAVLKEALRFHPPSPIVPRESTEQTRLQGYDVPAKTRILINAWAIGRDPKYWEKPEEFMPERFMNSDMDFKGQDSQFIPFGAGRRSCPGTGFAVAVVEIVVASLMNCFDWELPHGMREEDMDMTELPGTSGSRKDSLIVRALPRFP